MTAEPMDEGHEARKAHQHAPHPAETSAEIATLAPNIEVQKDWRAPEFLQVSIERVDAFLGRNTPK